MYCLPVFSSAPHRGLSVEKVFAKQAISHVWRDICHFVLLIVCMSLIIFVWLRVYVVTFKFSTISEIGDGVESINDHSCQVVLNVIRLFNIL